MVKGRTAVLKEYFKPFVLEEYDVPDPEPGASVVKISMAGLCGSDLHTWRGDHGTNRPLPPTGMLLGHEGTGYVHSLGKGLERDFLGAPLREGDRVIFSALAPCGHCNYCLAGDHNYCLTRTLVNGRNRAGQSPYFAATYADYIYLQPDHPVFRVPDELKDEEVCALNCAMGTVLEGLHVAGARQGQTVVTQGAGGLGLYAVALAKDMGAGCVVAIDGQEARLNLAKELGADEVININELTTAQERVERVRKVSGGGGADVVLELVGTGEIMPEGIDMLAAGGTYVEIGNLIRGRNATIEPAALLRGKRIVGSSMYRPSILPTLLDFLQRNRGVYPLDKVVSHRFSLADINVAFEESEWTDRTTPVIRSAIVP